MRTRTFGWVAAGETAREIRLWQRDEAGSTAAVDVEAIRQEVKEGGDAAVLSLSTRFGAGDVQPAQLTVDPAAAEAALAAIDPELRESLELAAANIGAVAEAQLDAEPRAVSLPQGQTVTVRSVPVSAAGIYAPGGRAFYPSSVLMCAIPARVAGVERVALASPPGPDGKVHPVVLAAAALAGVDEIFAMGGAQAVFALTYGTESVAPVDVIAGPGNAWVQEAKRQVQGLVGIDSYAGPSELMVIAGHDADPEWVALDLCAQAEHGEESPLILAAVESTSSTRSRPRSPRPPHPVRASPTRRSRSSTCPTPRPRSTSPTPSRRSTSSWSRRTPRCSPTGSPAPAASSSAGWGRPRSATTSPAPTTSCRPAAPAASPGLSGPGTFRRRIATVEIPAEAAAKLAPHADRIARAEGFPVHGESAMIRSQR